MTLMRADGANPSSTIVDLCCVRKTMAKQSAGVLLFAVCTIPCRFSWFIRAAVLEKPRRRRLVHFERPVRRRRPPFAEAKREFRRDRRHPHGISPILRPRQRERKAARRLGRRGRRRPGVVQEQYFRMGWPPRSGLSRSPEADRAAWFEPAQALFVQGIRSMGRSRPI